MCGTLSLLHGYIQFSAPQVLFICPAKSDNYIMHKIQFCSMQKIYKLPAEKKYEIFLQHAKIETPCFAGQIKLKRAICKAYWISWCSIPKSRLTDLWTKKILGNVYFSHIVLSYFVLGSSSIRMCRISNICCCFLASTDEKKSKQIFEIWNMKYDMSKLLPRSFSNFSCMFLNPNNYFQFEF